MATIALPFATRFIKSIAWELDRPAQVNESGYTGARSVIAQPWHGRWSAKAELAPIVGEANILAWRAFLATLRGQINTFRLPMTEGAQPLPASTNSPLGQVTAAGSNTMLCNQLGASNNPVLAAGRLLTVNDQPLLLTSPLVSDVTGFGIATFETPLRAAVSAGTALEMRNPTCLVALTGTTAGWSVDSGQLYGVSLDVREAF
jgi:hypothetical protein